MIYTLHMRLSKSTGQTYQTLTLFNAQTEAELFELFSRFYDQAEPDPRITMVEGHPSQSAYEIGDTLQPLNLTDEDACDRLELFYTWLAETSI